MYSVAKTSLCAMGTPASGPSRSPAARRASTARACARTLSSSTCRNALTDPSTARMRSRCSWAISAAVASPEATSSASSAAVFLIVRIGGSGLLVQDPRDTEALLLGGGRAGERLFGREARPHLVGAEDVGQRQRVRGRRDVLRRDLLHPRDRGDDVTELGGEVVELFLAERQPGKPGEVCDLVPGDGAAGRCGGARVGVLIRHRRTVSASDGFVSILGSVSKSRC